MGKVTDQAGAIVAGAAAVISGLIGIFTGANVQKSKIKGIEERLERIEATAIRIDQKVDRIVEREIRG